MSGDSLQTSILSLSVDVSELLDVGIRLKQIFCCERCHSPGFEILNFTIFLFILCYKYLDDLFQ